MTLDDLKIAIEKHFKITVSDGFLKKIKLYASELQSWNKLFNLTALEKEKEIYEKHFYDSLIPLKYVNLNHKSIIDVGSGAGFPGLVIALFNEKAHVTLLEPNQKKAHFLRTMVEKLSLENVRVIVGRAESQNNLRESFDFAIARAVKSLNILLELVIPLLSVKGTFIAMKGKNALSEISEARKAFVTLKCKVVYKYEDELPISKETRFNLFIVKNDITPIRYPRPYSLIATKPL